MAEAEQGESSMVVIAIDESGESERAFDCK